MRVEVNLYYQNEEKYIKTNIIFYNKREYNKYISLNYRVKKIDERDIKEIKSYKIENKIFFKSNGR